VGADHTWPLAAKALPCRSVKPTRVPTRTRPDQGPDTSEGSIPIPDQQSSTEASERKSHAHEGTSTCCSMARISGRGASRSST
jgi:hypothetical protein